MRTVVLLGSNGQLGSDISRVWRDAWPTDRLVGLTHADAEVTDAATIERILSQLAPDVVINTTAYHRVDELEVEVARAFAVNAIAAMVLARWCARTGAIFVHFSTDYVFGGANSARPYVETDTLAPLNVYGASKAAGEMLVRQATERHYIFRVSGLYGVAGSSGKGSNFVETMLRLADPGRPIRVVDDQILTPTPTAAVSRQVVTVLSKMPAFGIYHATCQGACSWFEFAREIFQQSGRSPDLSAQPTADSGARAVRPRYSVLENFELRRVGLDDMPEWRAALAAYLQERNGGPTPPAESGEAL